ncbi:hypothetical protein BJV85_002467 [Clostridium acetobutylicum]|uniref:Uncharacterized conserved protein n=1 Tax=Clostridium acetobutylicum (strain ATCC 824 / DSM 792 / JCM 1419 / IAM 19013 / LMG 5710 / NBRC 13948 / NRRL B-527 / VKM B-1787 / 2291 / W) TaxID=272562 RepID=Q97IV9_CLOAB|nr:MULTISPECIES: DUF438 domain-containing protein [Clostridium]AAK79498.1 Uncharacterized conserved protein [Clostridium acetobutylicum ATCC 824]ADZ20583.1 Conserved hypothetical protein [Clostridium acetobutylicum EA 2018]AEI31857.1 hypothetical protein SMB_G1556 [Clostridium acetobutylicum DSM 1731]AWV81257.1 DUF438 domain-containing protein [Clostridium acetobutylicum]MBC2392891.1 DUF438 domain-containing protein [Clostridium acetobutylicum]
MSGIINNREYRQKVLKEIILELHNGKSVDEVRKRFQELIKGVSTKEISEMEAQLIKEGMKVEEIQRLCDVHAAVFKGSIDQIHHPEKEEGHPVSVLKKENEAVKNYIQSHLTPNLEEIKKSDSHSTRLKLMENISMLFDLDKHYSRKENLIFPYLEKYGITAPPKVMWGVDDEIREALKECKEVINSANKTPNEITEKVESTLKRIEEMIFKEESILLPMCIDTFSEDEWLDIESESDEIGYCLISPSEKWKPKRENVEEKEKSKLANENSEGYIKFDTGILRVNELSAILDTLPLDITFVDKDGTVKYFSGGSERIFARTRAVIGRKVQNCHPPASVHIVEKVVEDLKSGKKDHEDFWLHMGELYVFIRYYAVKDNKGEFIGVLEVTQNIKEIQEITGEKRLIE